MHHLFHDPREVCQQFRRFNDAFGRSFDIEHRPPEEGMIMSEGTVNYILRVLYTESDGGSKPDAQSLRDAILNKSDDGGRETVRPLGLYIVRPHSHSLYSLTDGGVAVGL